MAPSGGLPGRHFLRALLHNRSLIYQLVRRDFEQRYVGSIVGWLWGLIHPLVLLVVYTLVFTYAFGMRLPRGEVTDNYSLFLFAGLLPWLFFSETLQRSASSLVDYANLIKKTVFPVEVVPLSILLSTLLSHLLAMLLLIVVVAVWLQQLSLALLVLPVYWALLGMFTLGLAWIVAGVHVYLRDAAQVLTVILTVLFWLTPIFLFEGQYVGRFQTVLALNPLTYVVRGYRESILAGRLPSLSDALVLAAFAGASVVLGGLFFRYAKRGFADVL